MRLISILNSSVNPPTSNSCNTLLEEGYMAIEEELNVDINATDFLCDEPKIDQ